MIVMVAFLFIGKKTKEPIITLSVWSLKRLPGVLACIELEWSSCGIFIYYIVQYLQVIRGATPPLTRAMLSPVVLYGRMPAHFLLMGSMVFFCIRNIPIATTSPDQI